ncbi:MAG: methyltransferase domain-containing protein, partial [Chloroflexi bacterium]|nr:methyltransferase domain-containing protein [Chloroflexota bacterium]
MDRVEEHQQRKQAVAGVFGRAAATYDTVGPHFFAVLGRRLVEVADVPRGARVLDVATGRGAVLFPLAEPMVQATDEEIVRRGIRNADVRVMDAEKLQFADETFDVVTCGFAIFFLSDVQRGFSEFRRVLKPGGRIALSTWGEDDTRWSW